MKLISWNVNGIRSVMTKGFADFVEKENPDFLLLQEIKCDENVAGLLFPQYRILWNPAEKKGYSGTAIFSKEEPIAVVYGMGLADHDREGRVVTAEYKDFFIVNVYTPNSQRELLRLPYRMEWDGVFLKYLKNLEKKKPVIFAGDLNVAHQEIDLANPKSNRRNAGFTDEERAGFSRLVDGGFVDTFREFNKNPDQYTWWTYRFNARAKNVGWRIDYVCVSQALRPRLKDAFIRCEVMGSDHCPVGLLLKD